MRFDFMLSEIYGKWYNFNSFVYKHPSFASGLFTWLTDILTLSCLGTNTNVTAEA